MPDVVPVALPMQLLAFTLLAQFTAIMAVLWRGLLGLPQVSTRRPRWPFIPLILGTATGVWYAVLQQDLVFGAAQGLALFLGFCLINSTRGEISAPSQTGQTRRERREAARAAKKGKTGNG